VIRLPESLRLAQKDIPRYAIPSPQTEAAAGEEGSEEGDMEVGGAGGRGGRGGGARGAPDGRVIVGSETDRNEDG
jgi:hypothetical protein